MIALAAAGRALHLTQKRVHFTGVKTAAGAHRMVAGHRGQHMIEPLFERRRSALVLAKRRREIAHETPGASPHFKTAGIS